MVFPKDEELFRNVPEKGTRWSSAYIADGSDSGVEPISAVYDRCYKETAAEALESHHGSIKDYGYSYQQEVVHKDFDKISSALNRALSDHLEKTDGYIGKFPTPNQYYATVDKTDDYYFDYFGRCRYTESSLNWSLKNLNKLVYQGIYRERATKSALALLCAIGCAALMWFCQGWFFTYSGLGIVKIAALALVFVVLLAFIWQTSADPDKFELDNFTDDSPAEYFGIAVVVALVVRIFFSAATDAKICCAVAGICAITFLVNMLEARKHLKYIQTLSPELAKLSAFDRKYFEKQAQRSYRLMRFRELWYENENGKDYKHHATLDGLHQNLMKIIDEYEEWCSKYLRDSEDEGY